MRSITRNGNMTISRVSALLLGFFVAGSLFGQDKSVRTLTTAGMSFKLPGGWDWHSDIASNATGFLEDTLSDLQKKVAASKGDLKDLKIVRGEKFGVNTATMATY